MWRGGEKLLGSGYRTGFGDESEGGIRYLTLLVMMMMMVMTMMVMMKKKG